MDIRRLDPTKDRAAVASLFDHAADYVLLETGRDPNADTINDFFDDRPPGLGPEDATHIGLFMDGTLIGVLAQSFGYPSNDDSYIGLLVLAKTRRGQGLGTRFLDHATRHARNRGATRQLVAVLDANPKGRAFWERAGFVLEKTFLPTADGHTRHRMTRAI